MMKYLLYNIDGFLKKFPLEKKCISIGREESNDIVIDNRFISRRHVNIIVGLDAIVAQDAGSANGILVNNERVIEAELKNGDSFKAGEVTFFLHSGDTSEFTLSKLFTPDFIKAEKEKDNNPPPEETKIQQSIFKKIESDLLHQGLTYTNFNEFLSYLSLTLQQIPDFGAFFLVEQKAGKPNIHLSLNTDQEILQQFKKILAQHPELFQQRFTLDEQVQPDKTGTKTGTGKQPGKNSASPGIETVTRFCAEPLSLGDNPAGLIYFPKPDQVARRSGLDKFLVAIAKIIDLLYKVMEEKKEKTQKLTKEKHEDIEIITNSETIKALIQQTRKIAASDVFVLIEGESGTGKELFARLLHCSSQRDQDIFIALNCAAIPENLLESELFGYEKGAFTGAYCQKKGKLELASGGTLVLDEIGDMPLNLQAKLLRALQEHEFYRLGGSTPIKVNLRIISLTHQNLEKLMREKKFREDLFYRLVHRTITIPPLRERREDIPILINYFTNKFCRQRNRSIGGYSIKAFEALVNFSWHGNIRELENEINSIVNLTDDGERVDFEILSEKIKNNYPAPDPDRLPDATQPRGFNLKPERDTIIEVLEKHDWNKSRAAKDLNMTYHGLHKKMKKLAIKKSPGPG